MTAGKAVGALQCEREDEQEHKQNHMDVHEAFSMLKMSRRDRFLLRSKNKDRLERLSSGLGTKDELSTTERGCTPSLFRGSCSLSSGLFLCLTTFYLTENEASSEGLSQRDATAILAEINGFVPK